MDLIDKLYPQAYKIKKRYYDFDFKDLKSFEFTIIDDELDPFYVYIDSEGIEIDTDKYKHISLSEFNLLYLLEKLEEFNQDSL